MGIGFARGEDKPLIREDLPSSGAKATHEHRWVKVEGATVGEGEILLACADEKCGATKRVPVPPQVKESRGAKPVLFG